MFYLCSADAGVLLCLFLFCFWFFFFSLFCYLLFIFPPCMDEDLFPPPPANQRVSSHGFFRLETLASILPSFYFLVSHLVLQKNKDIYCPFPQMVFLFIPEGEGSSNKNDGEAFKTGRLPKPWRKVSHLKVVFRLFYMLQRCRRQSGTGFMLYG